MSDPGVSDPRPVIGPGFLDEWQAYGQLANYIEAPFWADWTMTGPLVRQVVDSIPGKPYALCRMTDKPNVSGVATTQLAGSVGAFRNVFGLTVGATYHLTAQVAKYGNILSTTPRSYQLGILDDDNGSTESWAAPVTMTQLNRAYQLPVLEFVATKTNHAIAFRLAANATATAAYTGEFERVAIWNLKLLESVSESPYRVQDTVYESSLLNHFDLASNSVGGRWWVDNEGVTQFSAELGADGSLAIFTDARGDGKLEYVDIGTSYDTRNVTNNLVMNNHGAKLEDDGWAADDISATFQDVTSTATWGPRSSEVDVSLYDEGAFEGSLAARAAQILSDQARADLQIRWIKWNAQEAPDIAAQLDVYSVIDVEFRGIRQRSRIMNIDSTMTPSRWLMTLQLERIADV